MYFIDIIASATVQQGAVVAERPGFIVVMCTKTRRARDSSVGKSVAIRHVCAICR